MRWMKLIALVLAASLLAGCSGGSGNASEPGDGGRTAPVPGGGTALKPEETGDHAVAPVPDEGADRALGQFGTELLRQARQEGESTLVSPLSVLLALSMTANGAEGDTLAAFLDTLGGGVSLEALNANCASLLADYAALGGSTQCNIANGLWLDGKLSADADFVGRCADIYGAGLYQADLDTQETVDGVNGWVKEQTRGMIDGILSQPPSDDAVLLLVNALYLKNAWQAPFPPEATQTMFFHPETGGEQEMEFLGNGTRDERYFDTGRETGVVLPYDDGRLAFVAAMPNEGSLTEYLADWDGARLAELLDSAEETRLLLRMPKFQAEWTGGLNEALKAMGLADAFDPDAADLSGMGTAEGPLYISSVAHRTRIEVSEEGTEAAAATAVTVATCSAIAEPDFCTLVLDRPFVYGIVDLERGVTLFLGTFEQPE